MPALLASLSQMLLSMLRQAAHLRLQQTAASLTLLTLMAAVPMAAAGLLVLAALPSLAPMRDNVQRFVADNLFLPSFSATVTRGIESFVASAEQLSAVGTVLFIGTALSAMLTIDRTLNGIWKTAQPRPLAQRLALYWSVLTIGPVLLGLAIGLQLRLSARLGGWPLLVEWAGRALPWVLGVFALTLIYRFAPNARVRWLHALIGALVAAFLIECLKRLLGAYLVRFPSYTVVYGAFAAVPLLLIWMFALWMSILAGALVAANLSSWGLKLDPLPRNSPAASFDRMLRVLVALARVQGQPVPAAQFRSDFADDPAEADRLASLLAAAGYLIRVWPVQAQAGAKSLWDESWLAAPDLPQRPLRLLFDRIWIGREAEADAPTVSPALKALIGPAQALRAASIVELMASERLAD